MRSKSALFLLIATLVACGEKESPRTFVLPSPDLSGVAERVREQLVGERERVETALAAGELEDAERGRLVGELGRHYHAYDLTTDARLCYLEANRLLPDNPNWSYLLGFLEQVEGNLEAAERYLRQAAAVGAEPISRLRLAMVLAESGRSPEAQAIYLELAEEPILDASAALRAAVEQGLGRAASDRGDHAAAAAHFERALAGQPEATSLHYVLGQAYRELGRSAEADEQMQLAGPGQVAFPDPRVAALDELAVGAGVQLARGGVALAQGRVDVAVAEYREAVAREPENVAARVNLAAVLQRLGELEEAHEHVDEALRLQPASLPARLAKAELLNSDVERRAEAIDAYSWVIERHPETAAAYRGRAVAHQHVDDRAAVVADLRKLTELEPHDHDARVRLAFWLRQTGDLEGAERQYETVVESGRRGSAAVGIAHGALAHMARERGDLELALRHYEATLEDFPDNVEALLGSAGILVLLGRGEEALGRYEALLEQAPRFVQARFSFAEVLLSQGRVDAALGEFRRVVDEQPENERARLGVAVCLKRLGRLPEALASLEESMSALPRSGLLANELALTLASASDRSLRDGGRALELARQLFASQESPAHVETLAMALAEVGRYADAAELQRGLIESLGPGANAALRARLQSALALYERGEACCAPPAS